MHCDKINEWMSEHLDGQLDPIREKLLQEHVASCETCRHSLAELEQTVNLLQGLEPVEPPAHLLGRVHAKLEKKESRTMWAIFSLPQARVAIAAGLVIIVTLYGLREIQQSRSSQDINESMPMKVANLDAIHPQSQTKAQTVESPVRTKDLGGAKKSMAKAASGAIFAEKADEEVASERSEVAALAPASAPAPAESRKTERQEIADSKAKTRASAPAMEHDVAGMTVARADRDIQPEAAPAASAAPAVDGRNERDLKQSMAASDELKEGEKLSSQGWRSGAVGGHENRAAYSRRANEPVRGKDDSRSLELTLASANPDSVLPALEQAGWGIATGKRESNAEASARVGTDKRLGMRVVSIQIPAANYSQFIAKLKTMGTVTSTERLPAAKPSRSRALAKELVMADAVEVKDEGFIAQDQAVNESSTNVQDMISLVLTIAPLPTAGESK